MSHRQESDEAIGFRANLGDWSNAAKRDTGLLEEFERFRSVMMHRDLEDRIARSCRVGRDNRLMTEQGYLWLKSRNTDLQFA